MKQIQEVPRASGTRLRWAWPSAAPPSSSRATCSETKLNARHYRTLNQLHGRKNTQCGVHIEKTPCDLVLPTLIRDSDAGDAVAEVIRAASGNCSDVFHMRVDLSDQKSVGEFAKAFCERFDKLHYLVNNAGICPSLSRPSSEGSDKTDHGIEITVATNYLGQIEIKTSPLLKSTANVLISRSVHVDEPPARSHQVVVIADEPRPNPLRHLRRPHLGQGGLGIVQSGRAQQVWIPKVRRLQAPAQRVRQVAGMSAGG